MTLDTEVTPLPSVVPPLADRQFNLLSRRDALARYTLKQGETTIGRSEDNDIVVLNPAVSRRHATILLDGPKCTVTDHNSQNKTFLNGMQVVGTRDIKPGDVLGIADVDEFRFVEI
jgi:pSer/pThr/pTyr-binding forkhead associated (FHA) protein